MCRFSSLSLLALLVLPSSLVLLSAVQADDDEGRGRKGKGDKVVHELMEKTHEGKNSPWKRLQKAVAADAVDWAAVGQSLPRVSAMAKALGDSKVEEIKDSSQSYVDAVKDLAAAAQKQDSAAAKKAVASLGKSCSDCHSKGGIGGRLEHEGEEREIAIAQCDRPHPRQNRLIEDFEWPLHTRRAESAILSELGPVWKAVR